MAKNKNVPDLSAIESDLSSVWGRRNDIIREMRTMRWMENEPEVPSAIDPEIIRTPVANQAVERVVGALTAEPPRISVPALDDSPEAQAQSSKLELVTAAALKALETQANEDVKDKFIECLAADGAGCMRMMHAPQFWQGYPGRAGDELDKNYNKRVDVWLHGKPLPIAWTWIDPLNAYPTWDEMGLSSMLEVDNRDATTLHPERWNVAKPSTVKLWEQSRVRGNKGKIKFAQYWTRSTLTYAVGEEVVHHEEHGYQRPPYIYEFGISPATREPAKMGISMLFPLRFLIPYYDRLLSQRGTAIRLWCWPTPVVNTSSVSPIGEDGMPRSIVIEPGKTVSLFPEEKIGFLTWEGSPPDLDKMTMEIRNLIERASIPDAMFGQSMSGDSGYLVSQLLTAAKIRFKPLVSHAERAMENAIRLLWDIIEYQIGQRVYLWQDAPKKGQSGWLDIGPDDLKGYRMVTVKLNPIAPTDTYSMSSQMINEVNAKIVDLTTAREKMGYEQPDMIENRILIDTWKQSPEVIAFFTQRALERAKIMLDEEDQQGPVPGMGANPQNLPPAMIEAMMMQQGGGMPMSPGSMGGPGQPVPPTAGAGGAPPMGGPPVGMGLPPPPMGGAQMGPPPGGPPMGGPSAPPAGGQLPPPEEVLAQIAQMLQSGMDPQKILQFLVDVGLSPQQAMQLIDMVMEQLQGAGGGGPEGQGLAGMAGGSGMGPPPIESGPMGGGLGMNPEALPPESGGIMAGPSMPAIPQNTNPEPRRVGKRVKVSGQASGRAPGNKRT